MSSSKATASLTPRLSSRSPKTAGSGANWVTSSGPSYDQINKDLDTSYQAMVAMYVIRCTQQMETAAQSDHLLYLEKGRVLHAGTPGEVFSRLSDTSFYPLSWRCRA